MERVPVLDFYGKTLGFVATDNSGNKTVTDFYGRILGYYKKDRDMTTYFDGRPFGRGDQAISLIHIKRK